MKEYPKINSIFKRDEETHKFIMGQWSQPEFEYLQNNEWIYTEKINGTNIRVCWYPRGPDIGIQISQNPCAPLLEFKGKTDNAQAIKFLWDKLGEIFTIDLMMQVFPSADVCLYGEGYGARIQGGGNYIPNGVDFVLFDILIGHWWLKRIDIEEIANKLGIRIVPIVGRGSIQDAIYLVQGGLLSRWGNFKAEGLVLKPAIDLIARNGQRIITKMKWKDF